MRALIHGAPAATAGIRVGDRLLRWRRSGPSDGPGDAPSSQGIISELLPGTLALTVRPVMPPFRLVQFDRGQAAVDAGDFATATKTWDALAQTAQEAGSHRFAAWLALHQARILRDANRWPEAAEAFRAAVVAARTCASKRSCSLS